MLVEKKTELTLEQTVIKLRADLNNARYDIDRMCKIGGFTDAKTHSMRATRLEDRVEVLERNSSMLVDVTGHLADFAVEHSRDRHDADPAMRAENGPDVVSLRRIKRRLAEWIEACRPKKKQNSREEALHS